ncbi:deoxyribonuclease TATDN1, partial [Asbolus verrucosus]
MYSGIYNGTKKHQEDLEQVLQRSWEAGMEKIIITERLYSTVGCHPTRCLEFQENSSSYLTALQQVIQDDCKKVVAIGECGLDYDRIQFCPKETQKKYFELQLNLSKTFDLPLFLHCRNAASDLAEILSKFPNLRGVVHSFDGTIEEAKRFIDMNFLIGLNG